jgi:predicted transcriptional regulator of viral defense system
MNTGPAIKKSLLGIELVRFLASQGDRIFSTERAREAAPQVGLKSAYVPEALYHLRRTGWIVPIRRGLYALSSTVPGITPVHEFEIAMALVRPAAISHWSALHHHGLTDQVPRRVFVLTTTTASIPRTRGTNTGSSRGGYPACGVVFQFAQVKTERFFGTVKEWIGDGRVNITDPERTLLDGLTMPRYCGDFNEVLHAFEMRGERLDLERIVHYALRLDAATVKRLGWVLEHQGTAPPGVERLLNHPIKGYRKLDPSGPNLAGKITT